MGLFGLKNVPSNDEKLVEFANQLEFTLTKGIEEVRKLRSCAKGNMADKDALPFIVQFPKTIAAVSEGISTQLQLNQK